MATSVLLLSIAGQAADRIERLLQARGYDVTGESDPEALAGAARQHRLVILEAADASRVAALTRRVRKQLGDHLPILAVAHGPDIEERVALLEAGADDVLVQPFDERELEALVEALLARTTAALPLGEVATPGAASTRRGGRGQVFAVAATKGGAGSTTLAVNTALVLAMRPETDVAIADMDLYRGQVAAHLDLRSDLSTAQLALYDAADRAEQLAASGARHANGLTVYAAPHRPDEGSGVLPAQARALVESLRAQHELLIVDVGTVMNARAVSLLEMADRAVITVTPEIPALRSLHGLLEVLADGSVVGDRALFVLNNVFPKPMLSAEQIEENLGIKFALQVPYEQQLYVKAVNEGNPVVLAAWRSAPSVQIRRLAAMLLGEETAEPASDGARRSLGSLIKRGR